MAAAEFLYTPEPDAAQLAALGLTPEDLGDKSSFDVFPENYTSVEVFNAMRTQWRTDMGVPVGLDYAVLPSVMRLFGVPAVHRRRVFDDVRAMEHAAICLMREQQ
ncbi:hypothetical protein E2K99_10460 [Herbaspirillum huttiense]|nr:hypothetical protein E2K99_10460 [Herbaspirillum huttiense]